MMDTYRVEYISDTGGTALGYTRARSAMRARRQYERRGLVVLFVRRSRR